MAWFLVSSRARHAGKEKRTALERRGPALHHRREMPLRVSTRPVACWPSAAGVAARRARGLPVHMAHLAVLLALQTRRAVRAARGQALALLLTARQAGLAVRHDRDAAAAAFAAGRRVGRADRACWGHGGPCGSIRSRAREGRPAGSRPPGGSSEPVQGRSWISAKGCDFSRDQKPARSKRGIHVQGSMRHATLEVPCLWMLAMQLQLPDGHRYDEILQP